MHYSSAFFDISWSLKSLILYTCLLTVLEVIIMTSHTTSKVRNGIVYSSYIKSAIGYINYYLKGEVSIVPPFQLCSSVVQY